MKLLFDLIFRFIFLSFFITLKSAQVVEYSERILIVQSEAGEQVLHQSHHQFLQQSPHGDFYHHEEHHHVLVGPRPPFIDEHGLVSSEPPDQPIEYCYAQSASILTQQVCVPTPLSSSPQSDETVGTELSVNVPNLSPLTNKQSHNSNIESYPLAPHQYPYDSSLLGAIRHYWREVSGLCLASAIFLNWLFVVIKRRFTNRLMPNDQQAIASLHQTANRSVSKDTNASSLHDSAFDETASPLSIDPEHESSSRSTSSNKEKSGPNPQLLTCSPEIRQRSSTLRAEPIPIPTTPSYGTNSLSNSLNTSDYFSRYSSDFDSIQRLGRGGFGIVFEAKNKIDDCHYAVKRICLPLENEARERVMREVRALAKLDHAGIVRYYNAWLETPPDEWLKQHDAQLGILHSKDGMSFPSTDGLYEKNEFGNNTKGGGAGSSDKIGESGDSSELFCNISFAKNKNGYRRLLKNNSSSPSLDIVFEGSGSIRLESENIIEETSSSHGDSSRTNNIDSNSLIFNYAGDRNSDSEDSDFIQFGSRGRTRNRKKRDLACGTGVDERLILDQLSEPFSSTDSEMDLDYEESEMHKRKKIKEPNQNGYDLANIESKSLIDSKKRKALLYQKELRKQRQLGNTTLVENLQVEKVYLYIQMQLCRKDTLKDWLKTNCEQRDKTTIIDLFYQIVDAVEYVHSQDLIHRDLKPSNIFFSLDGTLKIGDFGLCRAKTSAGIGSSLDLNEYVAESEVERGFGAVHTEQVGTQLYMSPEQLNGLSYNQKVDIYAMGLILLELLIPFKTQMQRVNVLFKARNNLYTDEFRNEHPKEHELVKSLLNRSPQRRPTATEIKQHELLANAQLSQPVIERIYHRRRTISSNSSTE